MKLRTIVLSAALFIYSVLGAEPIPFTPLIRNWSTADQGANRQNWSVAQDSEGIMYFANHSCLLEFDGHLWLKHPLPGRVNARSVAVAPDGRIYVGSYKQFGYFEKISDGSLEYHSVSDLLKPDALSEDDIWNIVFYNDKVLFQAFDRIFVYDGTAVSSIAAVPLNLFNIDGTLYSQIIDAGVNVISDNGEMTEIMPASCGLINSILPYDEENLLMASANNGLYLYNRETEKYAPFQTFPKDALKGFNVNRGVRTDSGIYIYGSGSEGIVALDRDGKLQWRIDKNRNLQNETVLGLLCDKRGNVWAALDNGVSLIMTNSEISCYESKYEHLGMVYDILQDGGSTYIATNKGLFTYGRDKVVPVDGVSGQTWYLEKFDNDLFVGNNAATYRKSGASFAADAKRSGAICMTQAYWSDNVPYLFEGTYTNIRVYRKDQTGRWQPYSEIPGTPLAKNIEVDASFHIWYEHLSKGITRITLSEDMREVVEEKTFAELDGPQHGRLSLFKINGRICISDGESFYTYDDITDSITPYKALNDIAGHISGVHQAIRGEKTTYWLTGNEEIVQIDCSSNKYHIIREIPLILFGSKSDDRASLSPGNDPEHIYLCLDDKLIRIGQAMENDSQVGFSLFQAQMTNARGETYSVGLPVKIKTRRGFNNVTFFLRCTQYDRLNLKILYRVKGLDDNWRMLSPYNMKLSFARLAPRHYRFQARLVTHDDIEVGAIDVPIQVLSKWSRSRTMILLYLLLLVSVSLFVGRNAKKLIQWVKFLQDSVLSAMSAKEEIADQLKAREKDLAGIMVGGISTDNEKWEIFRQNFNRVDEHFFSNLSKKYPSLTTSDLKFCALLRLNMNTKEIATALNLTTRGVESARYRLRKKFNLGQNESLTAFIHNIK